MEDRENKLEYAANLIENNLMLLGATAIEDQLQDQVLQKPMSHRLIFNCVIKVINCNCLSLYLYYSIFFSLSFAINKVLRSDKLSFAFLGT